jgi:hypothetical protein
VPPDAGARQVGAGRVDVGGDVHESYVYGWD